MMTPISEAKPLFDNLIVAAFVLVNAQAPAPGIQAITDPHAYAIYAAVIESER